MITRRELELREQIELKNKSNWYHAPAPPPPKPLDADWTAQQVAAYRRAMANLKSGWCSELATGKLTTIQAMLKRRALEMTRTGTVNGKQAKRRARKEMVA